MAVNDLMMRIQLLADTGKSTAELNRLQQQLKALTEQLKRLEQTSLSPLANDLKTIKAAQSELKATNLQTFAKTLDEVKKSFNALSLPTKGIDDLKKGYESLEKQIRRVSLATDQYNKETVILNARLKEAKKNQLTGDGQSVNRQWVDANKELKNYGSLIQSANQDIRTERQLILDTKRILRSANTDYQASLVASGRLDLSGLKAQLVSQKEALKQSNEGVKYYRESLKGLRDDMRNLEKIGKSISAKKLIDTATLFPGTQINRLTRDFNSTNDIIKQLKTNLKSIQDSPFTFRINSTTSVRSIGTIKREITATKEAIKDAGKVKFDPQINVRLAGILNGQKIAFNETFDSLQKFNTELLKQKSDVSTASNLIKGYQSALRGLRLEAQQKVPDFSLGGTRNLISDLNNYKTAIRDLRTKEIVPLGNELRNLSSIKSFQKAVNIAPLDAAVARLKAQNAVYKEALNVATATNNLTEMGRLSGLISSNKDEILAKELKSAQLNEAMVNTLGKQIANTKSLLNDKKNSLSVLSNEEKNIRSLMTAERERAKQAALSVKTRSGGILDTTNQLNQARSLSDLYKSNVSSLNDYYQSLKRIAQVTKENASSPLSTLFGELKNARNLEEAQKRIIANKQKDSEIIRNSIKSEEERYRLIARSQQLNNQLDKKNLQARIDAREIDLKSLQSVSESVKSRIAATRSEIEANRAVVRSKQEQLQSTIFEAQQRIASGQLTKQQYNEERTAVRSAIAEQKELSRAYQQQLRDHKESLSLSLKAEKASATALRNQVKELMALNTAKARTKAIDLSRQYNTAQGTQNNLRQQIQETEALARAELLRANALAQSSRAAGKAKTDFLGLNGAFGKALGPIKDFSSALGFMFGPQMAGFAAAGTLFSLGVSFIEANKQVELLVRGLNAISEGNGKAELSYLVDVSNRLGVSIQESAHAFLQLEATTAGTAIEGAKTKQIFESFARALNVTGADTVTFNRAFRSISQSLSKGQLYAEELKGQLAEALPGAVQIFARAIDVTPKKFMTMLKAGQFAGQTLYDLYELVSLQLDKTFKVGEEKDFTFIQKANLAKNAFVELSVEIGKTGIWKALSDGMLYFRDNIVAATKEVNDIFAVLNSVSNQNSAIFSDIIKNLNDSLSTTINLDNVEFSFGGLVRNFRYFFQSLPEVARQEMKPLEDAFAEFDITKAFKDFVPNLRLLVQQLAIVIAAFNEKGAENPFKVQLKSITAEIGIIESRLGSLNPSIPANNDEIARLSNQLSELKQKQEEAIVSANKWKEMKRANSDGIAFVSKKDLEDFGILSIKIDQLDKAAAAIKRKGSVFGQWFSDEEKAKFDDIKKQIDALSTKRANIELRLNEQQLNGAITQTETLNSALDDVSKKRDVSVGLRELNQEQIRLEGVLQKYADKAISRARDNQRSIEGSTAAKERDLAVTKNQLAYERKILDLIQEQRDAQAGFAKSRYDSWVKSGSMSQATADFLTKSAENDSALKAIRDAQNAVESYNKEKAKGSEANDEELKLLRSNTLELLKLGSEKAKQTGNEYKYNQLIEERKRLLGEERTTINEGAEAVYQAKLKLENPQTEVDAAKKLFQDEADKKPITYRATIAPEFSSPDNASQQSAFLFTSFRQEYQQTQQTFNTPLRIVVNDDQVSASLQDLSTYQSKIQDIQTQSLPGGKTEIIVTPKINESALQEGFRYIKTSAEAAKTSIPLKPIVDQPALTQVKKTAEQVKKEVLDILDKDGKKVNFIVSATGVTAANEDMKRLAAQKEIKVSAYTDQPSLDATKKKFDEAGGYIKDGLRGATTISPQGIKETLDKTFGKGTYQLEITPALVGGVTEDGWIKNNEIKRNLVITPVAGSDAAITGMIQQQSDNIKSGYEGAWQRLRELDAQGQQTVQETPIQKKVALDTVDAYAQDSDLVSNLSKEVTKYVNVVYRESGSSAPARAATGGYFPGYGGGDRIHALLEAGEFVLRKEAVRKLGLSNVFDLNNLNIPKPSRSVDRVSIPSFSSGGYVGSSSVINIHVPNGKAIQVTGSRESATALANLLTRVSRSV